MNTVSVETARSASVMSADSGWRDFYRVGAISAFLFVILNIVAIGLDLAAPPPVSGGAATLEFIASNRQAI
ncbi:MAG: hypothetical protein KIT87_15290 [Anaerolineae bacterium]|nr:hypothetical protein [Anaerolineae bacterium]